MAGSAFTAPIKHSPTGVGTPYGYRSGTGMVPSAEYFVWMEDFDKVFIPTTAITNGPVANTPWGWQGAIIDSGATVAVNTTAAIGANGVLTIADATAGEGAAFYGQKTLQLTVGKKFWMEVRMRTDDVTDNVFQFGLSSLTAVSNPEDLWTTTATDFATFGIQDGAATTILFVDKSNSGSTAQTGTKAIEANAWNVLAIYYDGANIHGYVNGQLSASWSGAASAVPTGVALAPFVGALNGNSAGGNLEAIDYVRVVSER